MPCQSVSKAMLSQVTLLNVSFRKRKDAVTWCMKETSNGMIFDTTEYLMFLQFKILQRTCSLVSNKLSVFAGLYFADYPNIRAKKWGRKLILPVLNIIYRN